MKYLFFGFLGLLVLTFYHRTNHYDEAWLAEQAYWLVHDGRVRSEAFRGLNGWENQLFVFHKLFIYLSAGWQAVFGFSLVAGKSFSLLWTALGGFALWGYLRQQRIDSRYVWLGMTLYVANGILIEFSFVYRPEAMCITLGFASFWLLTNYRWPAAGLMAGLATLTHLNGLSFVVAGFGWLIWQRQPIGKAIGFGILASLIASFYLLDVALANKWPVFLMQFTHDPSVIHIRSIADKLKATVSALKFIKLSAELGLLLVGTSLLIGRNNTQPVQPQQAVGRYLLLLGGAFLILNRSNSPHYALQFVPFVSSYVAISAASWSPGKQQSLLFRWLIGLYLFVGIYRGGQLIRVNLSSPGITVLNARMASLIGQPGSRVIAPLDFFYEQIGQYQIQAIDSYRFIGLVYPSQRLTKAALFERAASEDVTAVITYDGKGLNTPLTDTRPLTDSLSQFGRYRRVYQDRWNSLYIRR